MVSQQYRAEVSIISTIRGIMIVCKVTSGYDVDKDTNTEIQHIIHHKLRVTDCNIWYFSSDKLLSVAITTITTSLCKNGHCMYLQFTNNIILWSFGMNGGFVIG